MKQKMSFGAGRALKATLLSVLMSFCAVAMAFAQQGAVKGTVIDDLGEPVIGANVVEKGTTNGTITDIDGNYTLQVSDLQKAVLQFSFIGYNTQEETVNGRTTIDVTLASGAINLGEVVAIGYGTQTRREITGSVANVDEATFNKGISRDASDLLRGKVAGLNITQGSSDVTRGSQIRLRGTSTLMNDQGPMIVIDGVPGGDMSTVSPADIESISVLKDASSQAIYGSRAAGGVILITTKKGTGAKTTVNYDGYASIDVAANKPELLNAQEWMDMNKQLGNDVSNITNNYNSANTDWFGELLRTGISQNHSVSLTGGSSTSNYRASYTYLERQGVSKVNELRRHSFRFQIQQRALENKLRLTLTGAGTMTDTSKPNADDFIRAYNMLPVYPVYNADGSFFEGPNGALYNEYDMGNPVHAQAENYRKNKINYFYGQGEIQYDLTEDLNVKANLYKSRQSTDESIWNAPTNYMGKDTNGNATRNNANWNRLLMEWTVNYNKTFGDHKVGALVGYSWENNEYTYHHSYATNFAVTSMGADNIQAGNELKVGNVTSQHNAYKLISFFGRATYSFKERYMLTATLRRDGSSKFGKNNKWGTFPSASVAWGISQENFMQNVKWVDDLKLRAGYGVTGNQDGLQPYKSLELYEVYGTYIGAGGIKNTAFRVSQNANPDLKWEQTAMFNVGLDFSLFNGRLGGSIEYYNKTTKDMLYNYAVPTPTYVFGTIAANVGDMSNKGFEMSLNYNVIHKKDFDWSTTLTLAHNKNEITKLSNDLYSTDRVYTGSPWIRGGNGITSHVVEVGHPVGQFYTLKCEGIDADGHFKYVDLNGDGQISEDDRTYTGSAQPDLEFGWSNSFAYKNWDASFFLRGALGQDVLNNPLSAYGTANYITGMNAMKNPLLTQVKESVKVSDFFIEDASYARLDNVTVGYTFNTKKIDWLDKARLYVTAQNLFVLTGYKGLDPEVELNMGEASDTDAGLSPGIEPRNYFPKSRSFTFGVNLTF